MADCENGSVDDLDIAILSYLQKDGRKSFTDIARALSTSVSTVRNRVTKLVSEHTVQIIGRMNPHRVGFHAPATINVSVEPQYLEQAIREISTFPEISYLAVVTGEYDLVVDVMCQNSDHLTEFLINRLSKVNGIKNLETSIVLRILKVVQPDLNLVRCNPSSSGNDNEIERRLQRL
jgi:Lrp/AsnC family transcriptional regulator for asnA, asnC and gidA